MGHPTLYPVINSRQVPRLCTFWMSSSLQGVQHAMQTPQCKRTANNEAAAEMLQAGLRCLDAASSGREKRSSFRRSGLLPAWRIAMQTLLLLPECQLLADGLHLSSLLGSIIPISCQTRPTCRDRHGSLTDHTGTLLFLVGAIEDRACAMSSSIGFSLQICFDA